MCLPSLGLWSRPGTLLQGGVIQQRSPLAVEKLAISPLVFAGALDNGPARDVSNVSHRSHIVEAPWHPDKIDVGMGLAVPSPWEVAS